MKDIASMVLLVFSLKSLHTVTARGRGGHKKYEFVIWSRTDGHFYLWIIWQIGQTQILYWEQWQQFVTVHTSIYLSVCLSICLSFCLSVCPSVCLSVCLSICPSVCMSAYLSVSVHLSVSLPTYLSVCLSVCVCLLSVTCQDFRTRLNIPTKSGHELASDKLQIEKAQHWNKLTHCIVVCKRLSAMLGLPD